jgi:hypothetical protein
MIHQDHLPVDVKARFAPLQFSTAPAPEARAQSPRSDISLRTFTPAEPALDRPIHGRSAPRSRTPKCFTRRSAGVLGMSIRRSRRKPKDLDAIGEFLETGKLHRRVDKAFPPRTGGRGSSRGRDATSGPSSSRSHSFDSAPKPVAPGKIWRSANARSRDPYG